MNKKQILASLSNIANELDNNGLEKLANEVTDVMTKVALNPLEFFTKKQNPKVWIESNTSKIDQALTQKQPLQWLLDTRNSNLYEQGEETKRLVMDEIQQRKMR